MDILQAHNKVSSAIQVAKLWSDNRNECEKAATLLRDTALKAIPEQSEPVGLAGTNITAVRSFDMAQVEDGNIIITVKDGVVSVQVYKMRAIMAPAVLEYSATKM